MKKQILCNLWFTTPTRGYTTSVDKRQAGNPHLRFRCGWIVAALFAACLTFGVISCDEEGDPTGPDVTAEDLLGQGWDLFERGEYDSSLVAFMEAIELDNSLSRPYNGAGWSAGRIHGMLEDAGEYFERSLELDVTRYDALGGWTFVVYQLDEWETALEKAEFLLRRQPNWRFLHEPSLDFDDVRLLTASANYKLGRYGTSLEIITMYFNNTFEADTTSPAGRRAILEEIERLGGIYG